MARTGDDVGALEILGKVAPLAATDSPLSLGASGRLRGQSFTLIGRLQLDYGLGPWNEWYAAFDSGAWGWLAEAQGRVYFTFRKAPDGLPAYAEARVGARFTAAGRELTIAERRRARFVSAEGELPHPVVPGHWYRYCDLEGEGGTFGTIDYGEGDVAEALYLGEQLTYEALFDRSLLKAVEPSAAAGSVALNCPNCGAAVELRAPDEAQRVTCTSCDALLDCDHGTSLSLLSAARREGPEPRIALGTRGRISGVEYTVYGHLRRSVTVEGIKYFWEEYLLRGRPGWRWLVVSDDHWTFVEPVSVGDVRVVRHTARLRGTTFRHFQTAAARVEALRGEFYWKVAIGETVEAADYVAPPRMLSKEQSGEEVTWSLGQYLQPAEVEDAFGLKTPLPKPRRPGACQPNPYRPRLGARSRTALLLSGGLLVFSLASAVASDGEVLYEEGIPIVTASQPGQVATDRERVTPPFEVRARSNLELELQTSGGVHGAFLSGHLLEQATGARHAFGARAGAERHVVHLGGIPRGTYALAFAPEWEGSSGAIHVRVRRDVFLGSHALVALLLLWAPVVIGVFQLTGFEKARWSESDHA